MELTYLEARDSIIEHTAIGYTIKSQDRLWMVFTFDLTSDGEYASYRYNRLYPCGEAFGSGWAYDMDIPGVLVWTTRAEAERYAERLRQRIAKKNTGENRPEVYVMNMGDDARFEAAIFGRPGTPTKASAKFAGSRRAWDALIEMDAKWREWETRP